MERIENSVSLKIHKRAKEEKWMCFNSR